VLCVTDAAAPAWIDAARASRAADVEVRVLASLDDLDQARELFDATWPSADGATQVTPNLARAVVHAGGYVSAAYADDRPVGAAFAVVGRHRDAGGTWQVHLHSHMAAVLPALRDRGIGRALKLHQRAWALEQGIDTVVWTFDPLVRRNVRLNLLLLGVDVDGFEPDFYGTLDDGINAGDPSDRLFAWWRLGSARVTSAIQGRLPPTDPKAFAATGADVRVVALPADIVDLRASDPVEARRWRHEVRSALLDAFAAGLVVVGVTSSGDLVLGRPR